MIHPTEASLQAGSLFQGRYVVGELVGRGSFAEVFRARDRDRGGAPVAIKVLIRSGQRHAIHRERIVEIERFVHEARTLQLLKSPQIPSIYEYGQTASGAFFMITDFVEGESLRYVLEREGALEEHRVIKIMEQLLMALRDAHECGLVHRDVKPENIVIYEGEHDRISLVDFGLSNSYAENAQLTKLDVTDPGFAVGTPMYMSPDQLKGLDLGPSSDLYAAGLIGFEMIEGRPAVGRAHKLLQAKQHLDPEPFRLAPGSGVSSWLCAFVEQLCEKEISARYQLASLALADLRRCVAADRAEGDPTGVFARPGSQGGPPGPPPTRPADYAHLATTRAATQGADDLTETFEMDMINTVDSPSVTHRLELSDYELARATRDKLASYLPEVTRAEKLETVTRPERPALRPGASPAPTAELDTPTAILTPTRDDSTVELDAAALKAHIQQLDGPDSE